MVKIKRIFKGEAAEQLRNWPRSQIDPHALERILDC